MDRLTTRSTVTARLPAPLLARITYAQVTLRRLRSGDAGEHLLAVDKVGDAGILLRNTLSEVLTTDAISPILVKFIRDSPDLSRTERTSLAAPVARAQVSALSRTNDCASSHLTGIVDSVLSTER